MSVLKISLSTLEQAEFARKLFLRNLALQISDEVKRGLLFKDSNVGTLGEAGSVQRLESYLNSSVSSLSAILTSVSTGVNVRNVNCTP